MNRKIKRERRLKQNIIYIQAKNERNNLDKKTMKRIKRKHYPLFSCRASNRIYCFKMARFVFLRVERCRRDWVAARADWMAAKMKIFVWCAVFERGLLVLRVYGILDSDCQIFFYQTVIYLPASRDFFYQHHHVVVK